jgi:D-glycero-D-manno-heptose 1,7-bisphosphate phosphatase
MGVGAVESRRAVFLDRDGVLNRNVYYADTREWESPRSERDLVLAPNAVEALRRLEAGGFLLFVVSNQPSCAKGKTSLEALEAVRRAMERLLAQGGISLAESFYCYHHPEGVVPALSIRCRCRKPSPYFLEVARDRYQLEMSRSWMVGDRDTDIECGIAARVRTVQVEPDHAGGKSGRAGPDRRASDVLQAAQLILAE